LLVHDANYIGHGLKSKEHASYMGESNRDDDGRPITPEIIISENKDQELRKPHIVLLQKIARGRTIQKLVS